MDAERDLPEKRNPLVEEKHTPPLEILVERRRLGQTELTVKPGQIGTSNATKLQNLGMFDYAHLRVPLPKDLQGSGIFAPSRRNQSYPEAYFLMRRSNDGYISATGMYKAAFPWSSLEEEEIEKKYIKSLVETDSEEIAGNVWIPPASALTLAETYSMRPWIEALLDPEPIAKGTHDPNKKIATPPRFAISNSEATTLPPPAETSLRRRTLRSASPAKAPPTPSRKIATPRRTRRAKPSSNALPPTAESAEELAAQETSVEPESAKFDSIIASSEALAKADAEAEADLEDDIAATTSARSDDTVKVDIETVTEPAVNGGTPTTTTHVVVETPASHPDLAQPDDAQGYLDQAKEAIIAARQLTAGRASGKKRKAQEMFDDDEQSVSSFPEFDTIGSSAAVAPIEIDERPAKRQRVAEIELRKEKIKRKATLGIVTSLAMGVVVPFLGSYFQLL
ncbi:DNA-binding domain of Mlu1-box binding protein MBP1 [Aureobasidium pullulans]|uniref:DNA-binding domain of Mlu1-box binding protein MBP1 n=1 Tax=Aureobasidium pullulans TaxID=5580 RepID=A0A4S9W2K0_AURPU|nr:DNA-binding domain of Mlu1-box binding protein MBP1 [Aureobasidium pullulans]THY10474.1 DNA-binding domain of Mlu1-box binding protein MBP1 [Aureobasidium pullulans]THY73606.1 DNA-binding domain of Mlu1-box binding protein MBP1 [Aureobasidium pullulans]THZ13730.1 DNA-binding domain of Mlu1-box binding protein MBP1 [Aureobasidium pullulans]THZ43526.1 DNA-binding domain of Mlu1-box binding protein MBP1 [Aureobasidium pullulans]